MKSTMQELEQLLMKLGETVYAQQQQQGAAAGNAGAGQQNANNNGNDDGVVDAEVVDDK